MKPYLCLILLIFFLPSQAATHHPQKFLNKIQGSQKEGKQIYTHFCSHCHATKPLIPMGAPRKKLTADWQPRLKQKAVLLFQHVDEGFKGMPPRGGCFECTDEQLLLAILELVPKKNKKALLKELEDYKKNKK